MATLQQQLASLNAKIASGTRSVTDGDQTVTNNTIDSLIRARNDLLDQINAETGRRPRRLVYPVQTTRGYD